MGIECNYSFEDLYLEAFGKKISRSLKKEFQSLSQEEINSLVKLWAKKAKWITRKKKGNDGNIYLSFHP